MLTVVQIQGARRFVQLRVRPLHLLRLRVSQFLSLAAGQTVFRFRYLKEAHSTTTNTIFAARGGHPGEGPLTASVTTNGRSKQVIDQEEGRLGEGDVRGTINGQALE